MTFGAGSAGFGRSDVREIAFERKRIRAMLSVDHKGERLRVVLSTEGSFESVRLNGLSRLSGREPGHLHAVRLCEFSRLEKSEKNVERAQNSRIFFSPRRASSLAGDQSASACALYRSSRDSRWPLSSPRIARNAACKSSYCMNG